MSGTAEGAAKVKAKILARDPDFYKRIGTIGGQNSLGTGFAMNRELAKVAGAAGGRKSSRKGIKTGEGKYRKPTVMRYTMPVYVAPKPWWRKLLGL